LSGFITYAFSNLEITSRLIGWLLLCNLPAECLQLVHIGTPFFHFWNIGPNGKTSLKTVMGRLNGLYSSRTGWSGREGLLFRLKNSIAASLWRSGSSSSEASISILSFRCVNSGLSFAEGPTGTSRIFEGTIETVDLLLR